MEYSEEKRGNVVSIQQRRESPVHIAEMKARGLREVESGAAWRQMDHELSRLERHLLLGGSRDLAIAALQELRGFCRAWCRHRP